MEAAYLPAIRAARTLTGAALGLATLAAGWLAFRSERSQTGNPADRDLTLLRLAAFVTGAFLLLTRVVHPWYVTLLVLYLPFLAPAEGESSAWGRFTWPGVYFSLAVGLSYLTYSDPDNFREFPFVRNLEYLPLFALLIWAGWPKLGSVVDLDAGYRDAPGWYKAQVVSKPGELEEIHHRSFKLAGPYD